MRTGAPIARSANGSTGGRSPARPPVTAASPGELGYRPALDGLRALAVLVVAAYHAIIHLGSEAWARQWIPGGFLGVDVFFVLSGFLITTILVQEHARHGAISLRSFYARRALRLLPAVGALMLVHGLLAVVGGADLGLEGRTVAAVVTYTLNWVLAGGGEVAAGLGHLWSLSIEEQFYLAWPVVLLLALRRRRATGLIVAAAGIGIIWATGVRAWLWLHDAGWGAIYVRTDARMDELLMGALLALAFRRGWQLPRKGRYLGVAGLAVLLVCALTVPVDNGWLFVGGGFTVVGLASVLLVASLLDHDGPLTRAFAWRGAAQVGRASYSLYLWHVPVFVAVGDALAGRPAGQRLAVGLVACALATAASYCLIEVPIARFRRRRHG
ncbi:MAG: acyltransferase family protein [Acidimicrobiales bacterium]